MPLPVQPIPAYILAGGRSSRFGSDKARAALMGAPLILHQAEALHHRAHPIFAVAREPDQYADLGLTTIPDILPDQGPLGGLRTALTHRARGWIILTSCDLIDLNLDWLDALAAARALHPNAPAIVFRDDRWQPFPGLYHTRLLNIEHAWRTGSLQQLLNASAAHAISAPNHPPIRQANTLEDLRSADRRAQRPPDHSSS